MNPSKATSWVLTVAALLMVGCGSSGGAKTATGGTTGGGAGGESGAAGKSAAMGGGAGSAPVSKVLLVDCDDSDNNADATDTTASPSDSLFAALLQGENLHFDTFVVPESAMPSTPAAAALAGYGTLVWYTGEQSGRNLTLSAAQEASVEAWLDEGQKTMLVFSQQLLQAVGRDDWTSPETNVFVSNYIGAAGDAVDNLADVTYEAKGASGTPFAGQLFDVISDTPIGSTADEVNPKAGTDTLVTVSDDPDGSGAKHDVAVVVGRKHVGAAGTSTVVYVGMPVENIQAAVNKATAAPFFHAALVYAGLAAR